MAAPSQAVLDNFNRANGALGANWSSPTYAGDESPGVVSNAFGASSGASYYDANWSAASFGPDSEVYATLTTPPATGDLAYMQARIQSPNTSGMDAYTLVLTKASGTDTLDVMRTINGVDTSIATRSQEVSAGDALGLVVLGTGATVTIQVWYRASGGSWTQLGADVSDTNANRITAAGRIGLGVNGSTARWDDFGGGTQVTTYTGSGSPSIPALTASGSGTFTGGAGTYTGSGDLAIPAATASGAGTHTAPTFTGSGDLALPAATVAGTGTFGSGVFTGSGDLAVPSTTASGTGTFTAPVYTGSGALTPPTLVASGAGVAIPGGGHLRFYGTDTSTYPDVDRVRIPLRSGGSPTAVDVGAGDFTYEFWLRCAYADNTSSSIADVRYSNIILDRDIWSNARGHVLGVTRRTGPILAVCFGVAGAGLTWTTQYGTTDVGDGEPHHVALVRRQSTGVIELYVDGALDASGTYSTGDLSYDGSNTGGQDNDQVVIGTEKHDVGVGFAGRLDDLRISNNRRYTGAFTPPTAPLTVDANTVGLYSFDDAAGTQAQDSASGVHGLLAVGGPASAPQWAVADLEPFEASGALTLPAATGSGAGTFTAPIYTGSGALTAPALTVDGAGTFATVGFTGTGDLQAPALTGSGSGTFTAPVYTGSGDLAVPTMIMAGSGTFTAPIYTGSGDLALPSATVEGTGIFAAAVYSGAGDLGLPALTLVGVGTFTAPVYTGSGDLALPGMTLAGVGTHIAPTYTGSGALTSTALTLAGVGTFAAGGVVPHATRPYRPAAEPTIYRVPPEPTIYRPEE